MSPEPSPLRRWAPAIALAALLAVFALAVVVPAWVQAARFCYAYYDLGIYSQGLALLSWDAPNPWLSGLQRFLFNDHFDPVLWLAKPLTWLFAPPGPAIAAEALFVLLSALPLAWLQRRGVLDRRSALLLVALLLLNPATLQAFAYPAHPTAWAMLPFSLLGAALVLQERRVALVALLLLFACKEEFPFVGVMLSAWLLWRGERRFALQVAALTGAWLLLVFVVRPWLWGPPANYAASLFEGLSTDPSGYALRRLTAPGLSRVGTLLLVLSPLLLWAWRTRARPDGLLWALLVPLVAIRFLGMKWREHYSAPLMAGVVLALVPLLRGRRVPGWVVLASVVLLTTSGERLLRQAARAALPATAATYPRHCPADPAREASVRAALARFEALPPGRALLGSNLVAHVPARPDVSIIDGPQPPDGGGFQYVLVEKPWRGSTYPATPARVEALIAQWRSNAGAELLIDDAHVFLARGQFTLVP